jgi:hypothetical protein
MTKVWHQAGKLLLTFPLIRAGFLNSLLRDPEPLPLRMRRDRCSLHRF